jgi:ABC-2 type transport system ATP-binding protein
MTGSAGLGATGVDARVIRVEEVRKTYGDIKAVDGVSFEVDKGEIFGMQA